MITVRPSSERGRSSTGWLHSAHSFSFGDYFDLRHPGNGNLLVLNDDTVAPGKGFGTHGHRDMEIVSYVLEGALAHQDNLHERAGSPVASGAPVDTPPTAPTGILRPGDVQRMSAGSGVLHSEFNHAKDEPTHFLQIWILPDERGIAPGYEQRHFDDAEKRGRLRLIAAPDGAGGAVTVHADARVYAGLFDGAERADVRLDPQRPAYVHLARGALEVNGRRLAAGDAVTLRGEPLLQLARGEDAEVLVFDLAP